MNPADVSYSQIARAARLAFGSKSKISFVKNRPNILNNVFEKDDSLYKKIAFYPKISIEEGVKMIMFYRKGLPR
jgi:nucleoside-diphosphate-sugar epimerase